MVEFAMVFPLFMLVLAGILDFGFALYTRMTVINAAGAGANAAVIVSDYSTVSTVATGAADAAAAQGGVTPSSVTTICLQTTSSITAPPTIACSSAKLGDSVSVTVNYTYKTFFPLMFGASFNMSSTVQMVIS